MVASYRQHCKEDGFPRFDRSAGGKRTCKSRACSDGRIWMVGRWGMRHLLNPFSLMLSTVFLVSCAAIVRAHQGSINGTRLSTCAHRMNGVSGFRHTKARRIRCVSCPVSKLLSNWYWISNALGLGYWNPRRQLGNPVSSLPENHLAWQNFEGLLVRGTVPG